MNKESRYDRQRRIWGDSGQAALESARVCLINASGLGAEILKNLVLPGIGHFHIVDGNLVAPQDTGSNFFVTKAEIGQPRASVVANHLKHHNPFVHGDATHREPLELLREKPDFFAQFTLLVLSNCDGATVAGFGAFAAEHHIDLIVARAYGQIGYLRLYAHEHTIIESKPAQPFEDLRINDPWPELRAYAESIAPERVPIVDLGHIPFACLLVHYLDQWRAAHGGQAPRTRDEKKAFKDMMNASQVAIFGACKDKPFGCDMPPFENYEQAMAPMNIGRAVAPAGVPAEVAAILASPEARAPPTAATPEFWVLVHALRLFTEAHEGHLPLRASIPDMISNTAMYVGLQRVFQAKAAADSAEFYAIVERLLADAGVANPAARIPRALSDTFAQLSAFIRVARYSTLAQEADPHNPKVAALAPLIGTTDPDPMAYFGGFADPSRNAVWYPLLAAADAFQRAHGRYPGASLDPAAPAPLTPEQFAADVAETRAHLDEICRARLGMDGAAIGQGYVEDIVRAAAGEHHSVAALLGGIAGEEAFKLVAHQFIPLNNTLLFNGNFATSARFEL